MDQYSKIPPDLLSRIITFLPPKGKSKMFGLGKSVYPSGYDVEEMKRLSKLYKEEQDILDKLLLEKTEENDTIGVIDLIDAGANPNAEHKNGSTALEYLVFSDNAPAIRYLFEHGADPNYKNRFKQTSFSTAIENGAINSVKEYIRANVDLNIKDQGMTPLHYALTENQYDILKLLLESGADPSIKDKYGDTPLDFAIKIGATDEEIDLLQTYDKKYVYFHRKLNELMNTINKLEQYYPNDKDLKDIKIVYKKLSSSIPSIDNVDTVNDMIDDLILDCIKLLLPFVIENDEL